MYRIVQEQLNNILKHSNATEALIELKTMRNRLQLNIIDNGVGFDTRKKNRGIGLNNIISRVEMQNGKMEIISAPGKGCTLKIEIPG
jgi:two-component system sensor histidine kinase UhpB